MAGINSLVSGQERNFQAGVIVKRGRQKPPVVPSNCTLLFPRPDLRGVHIGIIGRRLGLLFRFIRVRWWGFLQNFLFLLVSTF